MENLTDPREIRKHLLKLAYRDMRVDGDPLGNQISIVGSLTNNILRMCEHSGYSGEDTMTILAYQALLAYEKAMDNILEFHNTSVRPIIFTAPNI